MEHDDAIAAERERRDVEQEISDLAAACSDRERRFVEIWKLGKATPRQAMLEAGFAETTVNKRGPAYLLRKDRVLAYANALADTKVEAIVGAVKGQFLRLEFALGIAMDTLITLAGEAKDESVRLRASSKIVDLGKGILIASMPKKRVDFSVTMADIFKEAADRRAASKGLPYVEIEEEEPADDNES